MDYKTNWTHQELEEARKMHEDIYSHWPETESAVELETEPAVAPWRKKQMSATTKSVVSGLRLLGACNYDARLAASIIATRPDWQELLATIETPNLRVNVSFVVSEIRTALGLENEVTHL